jgi:hypothetical protein
VWSTRGFDKTNRVAGAVGEAGELPIGGFRKCAVVIFGRIPPWLAPRLYHPGSERYLRPVTSRCDRFENSQPSAKDLPLSTGKPDERKLEHNGTYDPFEENLCTNPCRATHVRSSNELVIPHKRVDSLSGVGSATT